MNRFAVCVLGMCVVGTAYANPYVSAKIGISDFVVDANQYMYHTPDAYKSTIVDGRIDDINAAYRAAVGLRFCDFRIEAEYGYGNYAMSGNWALNTKNGVVGSYPPNLSYPSTYTLKSRVQTVMLNAYYDINTGTKFTPYVGAGIGYSHLKAKIHDVDFSESKSDNNFTWQIGAGVSYAMTDNIALDAGYRYTDAGDVKFYTEDGVNKFEAQSHEFLLGARYTF